MDLSVALPGWAKSPPLCVGSGDILMTLRSHLRVVFVDPP